MALIALPWLHLPPLLPLLCSPNHRPKHQTIQQFPPLRTSINTTLVVIPSHLTFAELSLPVVFRELENSIKLKFLGHFGKTRDGRATVR